MNARAGIALAFFVDAKGRNAAAFGLTEQVTSKHPDPGQETRNECLAGHESNPSLTAPGSVQGNLEADKGGGFRVQSFEFRSSRKRDSLRGNGWFCGFAGSE